MEIICKTSTNSVMNCNNLWMEWKQEKLPRPKIRRFIAYKKWKVKRSQRNKVSLVFSSFHFYVSMYLFDSLRTIKIIFPTLLISYRAFCVCSGIPSKKKCHGMQSNARIQRDRACLCLLSEIMVFFKINSPLVGMCNIQWRKWGLHEEIQIKILVHKKIKIKT